MNKKITIDILRKVGLFKNFVKIEMNNYYCIVI